MDKGLYIVRYEMECEKLGFFSKIGCIGKSLVTKMNREFQSPVNRKAKLYFLFCGDPIIVTF